MAKGASKFRTAVLATGGTTRDPVKRTTVNPDRRHRADNYKEDQMLDALDMKRNLEKLIPIFDKLDKGHYDLGQAFQELSGPALKELTELAFGETSEKVKLDAVKHILGLAGHTPVQKHAVAAVNANQSKEALLALIAGGSADLAEEGIEVIDDREDSAE